MGLMMEYEALADVCAVDVHPKTVIAIIQVESGGDPWAINVNAKGGQFVFDKPTSHDEAVNTVKDIEMRTDASIDVGLMQVNSSNLEKLGVNYSDAFLPCNNITLGSKILSTYYEKASRLYGAGQKALRKALSAYNTGSFDKGMTNGYVDKVLAAAGIKKRAQSLTERDIRKHLIQYDKATIQQILNAPTTNLNNE